MSTIKELRKATGMTQKEFSDYFGIPKRNIENWEGGVNKCPPYLFSLIEYKLRNEGMLKEQNNFQIDQKYEAN